MYEGIPKRMKSLNQWVLWKYEDRDGRKTKIPYQINGSKADTMKPETWNSFENVSKATGSFSGIGFVFSKESGIMGVDFDHIRNPDTKEWNSEEFHDVLSLNSYAEISPSGSGAHVICMGEIPGDRRRSGNHEMYDSGRYFTVTGEMIPECKKEISEAQTYINQLYSKWFKTQNVKSVSNDTIILNDAEILEKCKKAKNGDAFKQLYAGKWETLHKSQSEADLHLCSIFAFYTKDHDQITRLFKGSGLYREKWDREDYRTKTINEAVSGIKEGYTGEKKGNGNQNNDLSPLDTDFDELSISEDAIKAAEADAKRILTQGDPIGYILNTIKTKHTGDENTQEGIAVSIAGQSCLNTSGLQISVNGESGSGKSHGLKTHLHLVQKKWKRETSLSAKAPYYMGLKPGMIVFSDDKDPDEAAEEVIKRATTNYQETTTHMTVKDQAGKIVTIPERINWYLTSVESNVSEQLLNRQLTFSTDAGEEQKNAIFEMQKKEAEAGEILMLEVTHDVLVCRRIYGSIKSQLFKVKIPFVDRIDIRDKTNSRIFPMFLDMIKGYTIFKNEQRRRDEDGYLLADIEDFHRAKRLIESQQESMITKLTDRERRIVIYLSTHRKSTVGEIARGVGMPYKAVHRCLNGRSDREHSGMLEKVRGLAVVDQMITTEEEQGLRMGKREKVYSIEGGDTWKLFDSEFITLKN